MNYHYAIYNCRTTFLFLILSAAYTTINRMKNYGDKFEQLQAKIIFVKSVK